MQRPLKIRIVRRKLVKFSKVPLYSAVSSHVENFVVLQVAADTGILALKAATF
jgi:hypothetical protein